MVREKEIELKLLFLDDGRWDEIFTSSAVTRLAVSSPAADQLEAQYFDTDSGSLQKAGLAYRIRKEKGQWVATVKSSGSGEGGLHQRQEWNVLIDTPVATGKYFQGTTVAKSLCEAIGGEDLKPLCITRFERQYVDLRTKDGSLLELSADRGEIIVGDKKEPIREIELELKEGKTSSVLLVGAELADSFPVLPEWRSKYYRALLLAGKAEPESRKMLRISEHEPAVPGLAHLLTDRMHWLFAAENTCFMQLASPESTVLLGEALDSLAVMLDLGRELFDGDVCNAAYDEIMGLREQLKELCNIDWSLDVWQEMLRNNAIELQGKPVLDGILTETRNKIAVLLLNKITNNKSAALLLKLWASLIELAMLMPQAEEAVSFGSIIQQRAGAWLGDTDIFKKLPSFEEEEAVGLLYDRCSKLSNALAAISVGGAKVRRMLPRAQKALSSLSNLYDFFALQALLKEMLRINSGRLMYRDTGLLIGWQGQKNYKTRVKAVKRWKKLRQLIHFWIG